MMLVYKQGNTVLGRVECSPEFAHAYKATLLARGVRDQGGGTFDLDEVNSVINEVGGREAFLRHMAYHCMRHPRGLDVLENLANEVCELARWVRMPNKLVRDKSGRSIGTQKVPGLGKLH